jgi:hypothetical protein
MSAIPEPAAGDDAWIWSAYFDDQLRVLAEDLRAEGLQPKAIGNVLKLSRANVGRLLAGQRPIMRPARPHEQGLRTHLPIVDYLAEFRPGPDTPDELCACGNTVFWHGRAWHCRTCEPPRADVEVQWFVWSRTCPGVKKDG